MKMMMMKGSMTMRKKMKIPWDWLCGLEKDSDGERNGPEDDENTSVITEWELIRMKMMKMIYNLCLRPEQLLPLDAWPDHVFI